MYNMIILLANLPPTIFNFYKSEVLDDLIRLCRYQIQQEMNFRESWLYLHFHLNHFI